MQDIGELNLDELVLNEDEYLAFTTNSIVKQNGEAVMGRGIAKWVADNYPHIPNHLGQRLQRWGSRVFVFESEQLISFPTKNHWQNPSSLELIEKSADELEAKIDDGELRGMKILYLPRPGCSNGGLRWKDVKHILNSRFDQRVKVFGESS